MSRSPGELADQVHDGRLRGHVEPGGRLVGDQQLRVGRRARWRSSPAGTCRPTARTDRPRSGAPDRECAPSPASRSPSARRVDATSGRGAAARPRSVGRPADRVEGGARILEDHRDFAAAQLRQRGLARRRQQVHAVEAATPSTVTRAAPSSRPHDREGGDRLARIRSRRRRRASRPCPPEATCSSARTTPVRVRNSTERSSTESRGSRHGGLRSAARDRRCRAGRRPSG